MATITDDAICIRRWDFSETSQTVSLLGREHGIVRGIAKGAKREKGAFSGGIELLARGELVAIVKPGRDLATLTAWDLQEIFWVLRQRLDANRAGLYMADLVHHLLHEHDPHPRLYDHLLAALRGLAENDVAATLLRFQWHLLDEVGYRPELSVDAETGGALPGGGTLAFSAGRGGVVADTGEPGRWRVRRETIDALRAIAGGDAGGPAAPVARANRLLAAYARELLGAELPTMRWLFSDAETAAADGRRRPGG